jgi:hypothetical protein
LAELQRGVGIFLAGALATGGALLVFDHERPRRFTALLELVGLPLLLGALVASMARRSLEHEPGEIAARARWTWLAGYGNSESAGDLNDILRLQPLTRSLNDTALRRFALARTESDFADRPVARITNYARRAAGLFQLGGQYNFYLDDPVWGRSWEPTWALSSAAGKRLSAFLRAYTEGFRLIFLGWGLLVVLLVIFRGPTSASFLIPLLFLAFLVLGLGLLGETQSRYLFPIWFILPSYLAWAASSRFTRHEEGSQLRSRVMAMLLAGLVVLLLLVGGLAFLRAHLRSGVRLVKRELMSLSPYDAGGGRYEARMRSSADTAGQLKLTVFGGEELVALVSPVTDGAHCGKVSLEMQPDSSLRSVVSESANVRELRIQIPAGAKDQTMLFSVSSSSGEGDCTLSVWLLRSRRPGN